MINIILCGGSGTRLWPLSRTMLPKQFVRLFEGRSLFQDTVLRNQRVCKEYLIVSNTEQYFLAADQLQQVSTISSQFLLEPIGRNTAPAIALACMQLDSDDLVLVTTSDHLVKNQVAYEAAVAQAKTLAQQGNLVTFGIQPDYAETGFGYIEAAGNDVISFKEKPSKDVAESYILAGNYYWNSGMFCFKAGVFLEELNKYAPEIYQACTNAFSASEACSGVMRVELDKMLAIPEDSIDYAVMEQSKKVKVIPCEMDWSDLGSFDALYEEVKQTNVDNAILKRGENAPDPICVDSNNNLLLTCDRQVALVDVNDLIIVDTTDAILISKKGSSQKVKAVVAQIKKISPEMAEIHRLAYRPWGTYEVLLDTAQYKIKRIIVKPGCKLSLQKHFHRNEHWIVVSGTATVTVGEKISLVRPNESTYIQMGEVHRLENQGKIDLVMIEVQVGEYTGEDDIVRIEDVYGR
ncbi:mannose-1-phosphate guanylyltransferase/mannose-6-phosphate isomerase [Thiomicrorhabdus arctica]|uniref:mannose-1-phosphate guanylyltransferase/mannose-6-phosphate isomerase n=1 Tax=Thiomicrorhabdus arctica TaxID=131540 RepID=UPI00036DAADF|nr:mannose-1-phosphate guanylyltransferase/mannose-6-phosphate isomerase [Thiomicrorhabdus arctica]